MTNENVAENYRPIFLGWLKISPILLVIGLWIGTIIWWHRAYPQKDIAALVPLLCILVCTAVVLLLLIATRIAGWMWELIRKYYSRNVLGYLAYFALREDGELFVHVCHRKWEWNCPSGLLAWRITLGGWRKKSQKLACWKYDRYGGYEWRALDWSVLFTNYWWELDWITGPEVKLVDRDGNALPFRLVDALKYVMAHPEGNWKDVTKRIGELEELAESVLAELDSGGKFHRFSQSQSGKILIRRVDARLKELSPQYRKRCEEAARPVEQPPVK